MMNKEFRDIISFDGTLLKCLIRETGSQRWLIVTHGLGEHLGRHEYMLKLFSQNFNIAIYDLRGHGRSGGKRGYVQKFDYFSKDLHAIIEHLRNEFSMRNYVLFGHSMGGLITANYIQNMVDKTFYPDKVYLSSPAVAGGGGLGSFLAETPEFVFTLLSSLPSLPLSGMLDLKKLSHDSRVYESYIQDEFNTLKIHSKLYWELLKTSKDVFSRPLRVNCPLYCSIGTQDVLVHPRYVIEYFTKIEKNAQLKIVEEGYHELHNEIEKYRAPYFDFLRESLTGLAPQAV
jgi:alpha-beta hydrolase superfamily lysophospholipase